MPTTSLAAVNRRRVKTDLPIWIGLGTVLLFFIASSLISYSNIRLLRHNTDDVVNTHETILAVNDLLSNMKDAETGQRGYLITGDEKYLEPYTTALTRINERISDLQNLIAGNMAQQNRLPIIKTHILNKLDELAETIALRKTQGFDAARAVVVTDHGKSEMDLIRTNLAAIRQEAQEQRLLRLAEMTEASRVAITSGIATGLIGIILSILFAYLIRRVAHIRLRREWLQTGQVQLNAAMLGEQNLEQLGASILKFVAEYTGAKAGAFFVGHGDIYRKSAGYGLATDGTTPAQFAMGESLLGQAAAERRNIVLHDVPDGYLTIGSGLWHSNPRHIVITPAVVDSIVNAVMEFGFIGNLDSAVVELLERLAPSIGIAVRTANDRSQLQNFLEETQRQAEELQAQSEELRVSNEELEEQSRTLKESQTRLEQQQAELEQTNTQLEEQAQILESQRDDLARAKSSVQLKAQELEQASQYKSDFLANMSHELRTPLNSSLILAKLLADNPLHNLTDEQVKFAQTIQRSGNDLLSLINDILDLSKIEAGHMDVRPEAVHLTQFTKDLTRNFEQAAAQKNLAFKIEIAPGCPAVIETDRQRLDQILKNLLSNAIKFTEHGGVTVTIKEVADQNIMFTVTDTGIGIKPEQQQAIFDAFRQADGTISRKYGGTGLGLSISRQLARLLGGAISLASILGQGSSFSITIPVTYNAAAVPAATLAPPPVSQPVEQAWVSPVEKTVPALSPTARLADDRETLVQNGRVILVVEDDEPFAKILYELVHDMKFQCLIAATADEALIVAKQYLPSAILLDVGLPDNSGLSVLDRLKRDPHTRHIPVHVVSGGDHAQTALSLGAVGYMLKPVRHDQLVEALQQLETRFAQRLRRVLIVEDDDIQRDSMAKLLGSHDVEAVGVGTAAECLGLLKDSVFDCMVLDLSLPDASGYSLLETLSKEEVYSFPPVIVYTGRDLSNDEEQRLRRYSKSIIIKGAKSPERLLDEVTLFLHQVVAELPPEQQRMLQKAHNRDAVLEGRRILVVEDDVANVYALTSILEPRGAVVQIARNGREAIEALTHAREDFAKTIDLVLMDVMMPEVDGLTATREIRKHSEWKKLPIIMLTAKAMRDDQMRCLDAGANDYMAKPLDVEKLLSLVRVWMPR